MTVEDRIKDIRRRMSNDYIFDEPGEAIISMDEDMEWALGVIESLREAVADLYKQRMGKISTIKLETGLLAQDIYNALLQEEKEDERGTKATHSG